MREGMQSSLTCDLRAPPECGQVGCESNKYRAASALIEGEVGTGPQSLAALAHCGMGSSHHSSAGFTCLAASSWQRSSSHCTNCLERSIV